ncbi:PTS sugar transporter subunit IIA [Austwickia chelonae]|uniref:PTS sugar transporter subunit IIA n=1 Tax=Austwickia chelonae TaxID=100225 RepID=UPI000E264DDD|nr:fructose PTS transporter subunit IIA [Austwickia chelonae]
MSIITPQQVILDLPELDRAESTRALAQTLVDAGRVTDLDALLADVAKREEMMSTGLFGGIAIPHCRSAAVTEPSLAFGRSSAGVPWGAEDGPATLIFLIAVPAGSDQDHLTILAMLARKLMREDFKNALRQAPDAAAVVTVIEDEVIKA